MRLNQIGFVALIALAPSSAVGQNTKRDFDGCIRQYVAKYASVCEAADVVARGIAAACAPAPTPLIGSVKEDHGAQVTYDLQKSMHEAAYSKALVAVLDGRASAPCKD